MKLPIPLLLYVVSLGLFGLAGWTVYEMLPLWKDSERQKATNKGQNDAISALSRAKERVPPSLDWQYASRDAEWWKMLAKVNFTGKLPPPPKPAEGPEEKPPAPVVEVRPLEDIIELVTLVYDGQAKGRGGDTYVIVRYRPAADVKPPEWYMRETMTPPAGASAPSGPRDTAPPRGPGAGRRGNQPAAPAAPAARPPQTPAAPSPIPTTMAGREILQKVWVLDNGDPRHTSHLWPTFDNIRLVGVSSDAQVAYFVRDLPPPKAGEAAPEPKEEQLIKTNMHLSQELKQELRRLQGRAAEAGDNHPAVLAPNPSNSWIDVPETKVVDGVRHFSKKDADRFANNSDDLLAGINVDTYVSKSSKLAGLIVRNVDPKLASTFGIVAGDVLLELNGRSVRSRSEAMDIGKKDYKRGVRTFNSKWLSNGAVVERVFQAPDR